MFPNYYLGSGKYESFLIYKMCDLLRKHSSQHYVLAQYLLCKFIGK